MNDVAKCHAFVAKGVYRGVRGLTLTVVDSVSGIAISLVVLGANLLGDGLPDLLDPRRAQ